MSGDLLSYVKCKGRHIKRARKRLKLARKEYSNDNKVRVNKADDKSKRSAV